MHTFWSETLKERDHLEDLDIEGDSIRMDVREMRSVVWSHLAQDWGQWRVLLTTVMNLQVP
jgi:hypothetical protein